MMTRLTFIDGPPGTGKTRRLLSIVEETSERVAVATYTRDAAAVVLQRNPDVTAGTIYSKTFTWPHVAAAGCAPTTGRRYRKAADYQKRAIRHEFDGALQVYMAEAPSRKPVTAATELARELHGWWPDDGPPPFDLWGVEPMEELQYILPLARWLDKGAPLAMGFVPFDTVYVDEAQDWSALELAAARALVKSGGLLECSGDPGQAIFAYSKGLEGSALPAAVRLADRTETLSKGWRCGAPLAPAAARALSPYWNRPAHTFTAEHTTRIFPWTPGSSPPPKGLVLAWARSQAGEQLMNWGLRDTWVVPGLADPDKELVVCTGHRAKGSEADNVYMLPWGTKAMKKLVEGDPAAIRLLYVMMTRARRNLFIPDAFLPYI